MKKIGIIGTRKRNLGMDLKLVEKKFLEIYQEGDGIISGGCEEGGDRFAEIIAKKEGIPILIFYPNKKKYGIPAAYFIRNSLIANNCDIIIACVVNPEEGIDEVLKRKTGGTEDTIKKFVKRTGNKSSVYLV